MVFSSLVFIYGFLPLCILLAFFSSKWTWLQNAVLLIASILFYSWGEPKHIWLFVGTIVMNWLLVRVTDKISCRFLTRIIGWIAIAIDLGMLIWFKYAGWIGSLFGFTVGSAILPIGISFYTFQAISYVADVTLMEKYEAEKNPINVGLYISFFPQLIAGPIIRYEEMREQIRQRRMTVEQFEAGCFRFILGFSKKVLLADSMGVIANKAFSDIAVLTTSFAWLGAIAYAFQILMDFSAYSDMAIGLGTMFGFKLPENFNNPYKAITIRDFWRRWHITLSIWFRDYVYIPLGGSRKGDARTFFNLAFVWLLTGIWHGANWTFVLWGTVYGMLVIMERLSKIKGKLDLWGGFGRTMYRLFTLLCIVFLWVLFRSDSIASASMYIRNMFRMSTSGFSQAVLYTSEYKWAFIGCGILCVIATETLMKKRTWLWPIMLVLFVVSISYLVKGTYSPFLYFNF